MNRQTDPEPVAPFVRVSAAPAGAVTPADPNATGERIRALLDQGRAGVAVAMLREMLSADHGVLLARVPRAERRVLVSQLSAAELSDILDEAPTEAPATIVSELPAARAAELLDDVDSHTVADILQGLPDAGAAAIIGALHRPQDVVSLLQYPPDTAGGMMTPDFPRVRRGITAGNALDALRLFCEDAKGFGWICVLDNERRSPTRSASPRTRLPMCSDCRYFSPRGLPRAGSGMTDWANPAGLPPCHKSRSYFTIGYGADASTSGSHE